MSWYGIVWFGWIVWSGEVDVYRCLPMVMDGGWRRWAVRWAGGLVVDFESERFSYLLDNSRFSYLLDPKGFCIFGSLEFLAGTVPAGAGFIQRG